MSGCVKESLCSSCIHREVCSLKEKFLAAQRAVDELKFSYGYPDGKVEILKLCNIGFIQPVNLKCAHYSYVKTTLTR